MLVIFGVCTQLKMNHFSKVMFHTNLFCCNDLLKVYTNSNTSERPTAYFSINMYYKKRQESLFYQLD